MNIVRNIWCDLSIPDATFPEEEMEAEVTTIGFHFFITGRRIPGGVQTIADAIIIE